MCVCVCRGVSLLKNSLRRLLLLSHFGFKSRGPHHHQRVRGDTLWQTPCATSECGGCRVSVYDVCTVTDAAVGWLVAIWRICYWVIIMYTHSTHVPCSGCSLGPVCYTTCLCMFVPKNAEINGQYGSFRLSFQYGGYELQIWFNSGLVEAWLY